MMVMIVESIIRKLSFFGLINVATIHRHLMSTSRKELFKSFNFSNLDVFNFSQQFLKDLCRNTEKNPLGLKKHNHTYLF